MKRVDGLKNLFVKIVDFDKMVLVQRKNLVRIFNERRGGHWRKKMIDIVVNGVGGSGKDTFISYCREYLKEKNVFSLNISSIDPFRDIPLAWGWNRVKDDNYRQALSYLKKAAECIDQYPLRYMLEQRTRVLVNDSVIFYHIREISSLEAFKKMVPNLITVFVENQKVDVPDCSSDKEALEYKDYDVIIYNNETIDELKFYAMKFVEDLLGGTI